MIHPGIYNTLKVLRQTSVGYFLGDNEDNDVLLPNKYVPKDLKVDDEIEVFIYHDSEDRLIATTLKPKVTKNHFASLQVKEVNRVGAFLDWGLEKDLLVPYKEQNSEMIEGHWYVVYMYLDLESGRLAASSKLNQFFENDDIELEEGEGVDLLVSQKTELGHKVIINDTYSGMVYSNEVFQELKQGFKLKGYIKKIREDQKIDVALQKQGYAQIDDTAKMLLEKLEENEGFLALHDKSSPDDIKAELQMSKKVFKKAVGQLYKAKKIVIEDNGIRLIG